MKISEIIKFNRKLKNMTQSELGEKIGVSQDTISIWEKGKAQPNYEAIQKMCIIFGLTGDEILQIETPNQRKSIEIDIYSENEKNCKTKNFGDNGKNIKATIFNNSTNNGNISF